MPSQKAPRHNIIIKPIYVDLATAAEILILSVSTIEALERDPGSGFPKKRLISPRRTGYLLSELEAWGENRPVSDLPPPPNTGAKKGRATTVQTETQDNRKAA